jgi:hypothetical protein
MKMPLFPSCISAAGVGLALALFVGCGEAPHPEIASGSANAKDGATSEATIHSPSPVSPAPEKVDAPHLPNAYRIHPKVISGGLPEGDVAFQELKDLGVKTVIDVDGIKPDIETASRYGMRYVHLPHGYDGIPELRARELAKAVHDLPGPIYVHCHHGKHRSPAAAAVACVGAGLVDPGNALLILETAGTSKDYHGLYDSVREARPLDVASLDAMKPDFPEVSPIPPLAEAMVALDHTHDDLKAIAAAGWKTPPDHPDLDPAHVALLLKEHFAELLRMNDVQQRPEEFRARLSESEAAAQTLEDALKADATDPAVATKAFELVNSQCTACHHEFRD